MKKVVKILTLMLVLSALMIIFGGGKVQAAVEYTREFPANDGTTIINLTGLNISDEKGYQFALVSKGEKPTKWEDVSESTATTAKIILRPNSSNVKDVLLKKDVGQLYVKEKGVEGETYVVSALEVNLKLPLLQALDYEYQDSNMKYRINGAYGIIANSTFPDSCWVSYTRWQKVTDESFIEEFLKVKNSKGDITTLESNLPSVPNTGYKQDSITYATSYKDGLYLLWVKLSTDNAKDVFGCIIHDGLPNATTKEEYIVAPRVTSIKVVSPKEGTYKTPKTVKIQVIFDNLITGDNVPTLKIKFGESAVRSLTNGTIKSESGKGIIEYSYNIQIDDKGQIAAVSLEGGSIKGASGNNAILSCPIISGEAIKANTEGQVNNQTNNQDEYHNGQTGSGSGSQGSGTSGTQGGSTTSGQKDKTTIQGTLPQTGMNCIKLFAALAMVGIGVISFKKYKKYKI